MKEYTIQKGQTDWRPRTILAIFILALATGMGYLAFVYHTDPPPSDQYWSEYVIPKGKHSARPYVWSYEQRAGLSYQFVFDETSRYDLQGADQKDWNKLTGLSLHWWTNHKNSAMVSWRYDLDCQCIELGFYWHQDGRVIKSKINNSEVWARAVIGGPVWVDFVVLEDINHIQASITTLEGTVGTSMNFPVSVDRKTREINPWFGGNQSAPQNIYINKRAVK